jgi:hypothetical protein
MWRNLVALWPEQVELWPDSVDLGSFSRLATRLSGEQRSPSRRLVVVGGSTVAGRFVVFGSAKARPFAERKATMRRVAWTRVWNVVL